MLETFQGTFPVLESGKCSCLSTNLYDLGSPGNEIDAMQTNGHSTAHVSSRHVTRNDATVPVRQCHVTNFGGISNNGHWDPGAIFQPNYTSSD